MVKSFSRFYVEKVSGDSPDMAYCVMDRDASQYGMPERAVSLYFANHSRALEVCSHLNVEWSMFVKSGK